MEVILRETIDTLGRAGQIVKVADGYARNYLLPRKLAYLATPGNLKVIEFERQSLLKKEAKQKEDAEKLKEMLDTVEIVIRRKVGEQNALYGSVTNSDVAEVLEAEGLPDREAKDPHGRSHQDGRRVFHSDPSLQRRYCPRQAEGRTRNRRLISKNPSPAWERDG